MHKIFNSINFIEVNFRVIFEAYDISEQFWLNYNKDTIYKKMAMLKGLSRYL
jgi:hypothetical protein